MRSFRKTALLAAMVAAVMAFALPAVASASSLTYLGKPVSVGSEFSATSTNFVYRGYFYAQWNQCKKVTLPSKVEKNSGAIVEAKGVGFGTAENCMYAEKNTTISNLELRNLTLESPTAGKISLKFDIWMLGTFCQFEGSAIPVTYSSGGSSINVTYGQMKGCGTLTINGDFALKNPAGNPLVLN